MPERIEGERLGRPMFPVQRVGTLTPYLVDVRNDGIIYRCFSNKQIRVIEKITTTTDEVGSVYKYEHATGAWDDRATLNYAPINEELFTGE